MSMYCTKEFSKFLQHMWKLGHRNISINYYSDGTCCLGSEWCVSARELSPKEKKVFQKRIKNFRLDWSKVIIKKKLKKK